MFQFTTTTILNQQTNDKNIAAWSLGENNVTFNIRGVNNFKKANVIAIYKTDGYAPELAKVTIDLAQLGGKKGDVFRLDLLVGLTQGSADSRYSNDLSYKGKPFSVDFVFKNDAATTAESLEKLIKKYDMMVYGDKILNVSHKSTYITIEATNEYQKLVKVNIDKFDESAHFDMGEYNTVRSLEDLEAKNSNAEVGAEAEGYFVGKEGFGTYSYLLHNISLPTCANSNPFAPNRASRPIPGAIYDQYVIHYCVNRGVLGDNAVGDVVKSVTTHVLYVKHDLAADLDEALSGYFGEGFVQQAGVKGTADPISPEVAEAKASAEKVAESVKEDVAKSIDEKIAQLKADNPDLK